MNQIPHSPGRLDPRVVSNRDAGQTEVDLVLEFPCFQFVFTLSANRGYDIYFFGGMFCYMIYSNHFIFAYQCRTYPTGVMFWCCHLFTIWRSCRVGSSCKTFVPVFGRKKRTRELRTTQCKPVEGNHELSRLGRSPVIHGKKKVSEDGNGAFLLIHEVIIVGYAFAVWGKRT